ncbi:hypothetical protein [Aliivibrio logei]|uniref:hypothetical protein n=1 Tax=Aliivibrio logei TaxID=688 RepID=UPI0035C891F5
MRFRLIYLILVMSIGGQSAAANELSSCTITSSYDIYLSGIHTGKMKRVEAWQGKKASIVSNSKASILGIGTAYSQSAEVSWSDLDHEWITDKFHQKVSGFRSRDMKVTFTDGGHQSDVDIDGKASTYISKDIPLRDVDTLSIQIRQNLLQGKQAFRLNRQASDGIEPYQYQVHQKQIKTFEKWGELEVIPVEQTGAEHVTFLFAPELEYQLVEARYHGFILRGLLTLEDYESTCKN